MAKQIISTRIPYLNSRIPQATVIEQSQITQNHLGCKVQVGDKDGILRYLGLVNFSKGVWCGIELESAIGKNDGSVNGTRYFVCPTRCGLMVPVCKVKLKEENDEHLDEVSGPHSMLFLENCDLVGDIKNVNSKNLRNEHLHDKSENKSVEKSNEVGTSNNQTYLCPNEVDILNTPTFSFPNDMNKTFIASNNFQEHFLANTSDNHKTYICEIESDTTFSIKNCNKHSQGANEGIAIKRFKTNHKTDIGEKNFSPVTTYSTPIKTDTLINLDFKSIRISDIHPDDNDDKNKRDSLDCEESLGILTPDQMVEDYVSNLKADLEAITNNKTFSQSNKGQQTESTITNDSSLDLTHTNNFCDTIQNEIKENTKQNIKLFSDVYFNSKLPSEHKDSEIQSPNLVDASVTEYSLGILDDQLLLSNAMNFTLPLDNVSKVSSLNRIDQTPSPEDLPFDPTPIQHTQCEIKEEKEESKTKPANSIITSITSITSLDTGYQGDGEMSRPASRGTVNSPMTKRTLSKPHGQEQLTDSDFYTESDADNHDENHIKGDRKAQVIDGTLYGINAQETADIYTNNRENMDSSGIFTDIDNRVEDETFDVSPSDTSTKTISENSQNNMQLKSPKAKEAQKTPVKDHTKKRSAANSPVTSSPNKSTSAKKDEVIVKKYKMPKRDVASKVKAMMGAPKASQPEKKVVKKPEGRWDAVMSKITKNEQNKNNLKDVKPKVFKNTINVNDNKLKQNGTQKSPLIKPRRVRSRFNNTNSPRNNFNLESSIHSSLSDVSSHQQNNKILEKKNSSTPVDIKLKKYVSPKEKKQYSPKVKLTNENTSRGNRTPLISRNAKQITSNNQKQKCPLTKQVEALAILIQHLVFNVEAFKVPILKQEVNRIRKETEIIKISYQNLLESLENEKQKYNTKIEEEKQHHEEALEELTEKYKTKIQNLHIEFEDVKSRLVSERENANSIKKKQYDDQIITLKLEFSKLQRNYDEKVDILREENDAVREQIDEKQSEIEKLRKELHIKESQYQDKISAVRKENNKLIQINSDLEKDFIKRTESITEDNKKLREENDRLLSYGDDTGIAVQEVHSLRAVLELKQTEVSELRKNLAEATQKVNLLETAEERANYLHNQCEDLKLQLQRKHELEQNLLSENLKLNESIKEEGNQKKRLLQHNEELQWRLQQNKEVWSKIIEKTEDSVFNRSLSNEGSNSFKQYLERSSSFRDRDRLHSNKTTGNSEDLSRSKISPPTSPKVKGVVEKSDSVSYVLDLDESPDIVASRIVRRSFRNSTPPKTTPTRTLSNNIPTESSNPEKENAHFNVKPKPFAWTSSPFLTNSKNNTSCFDKLVDNSDYDDDNDIDMPLPALPSELNRQSSIQALPTPKDLAGEALISESASEDESTSSSQL